MQSAGRSDLLMGRAMNRMEHRVLTEQRKAYEWSGGLTRSSWWLVARNDEGPLEVFTLDGGDTLPVFSGEGEAGLFLWLREERHNGWELHESSAEELVFVLSGPCSRAGLVALDPSSEIFDGGVAEPPPGLSREDFLEWIVSRSLCRRRGSQE
jgi:hypothetical protein